jgi:hypothetical protein
MKKVILSILILTLLSLSLFSADQKSVKKAVLFSAILPGAGQLYNGSYSKMGVFLSSEAAIWFAKNRFQNEEKWAENSYRLYAFQKAGVPVNVDNKRYNDIQNYISSEQYNNQVELAARNYFLIQNYDPEAYQQYIMENTYSDEEAWKWKTNEDRMQFKEIRRHKHRYEIYDNFTVGAMVINRLISVIDAAKTTKKQNKYSIYANPTNNGKGLTLNYEYKF